MTKRTADPKRGLRRVLRTESEWSAVEWIGLAIVIGACYYAFDVLAHDHHSETLGGAMFGGACAVVGILVGRRLNERRAERRAERQGARRR